MTPGESAWWIENIGKPMAKDVEGLKRALWTIGGGGFGAGTILGLVLPFLLKKWGLA